MTSISLLLLIGIAVVALIIAGVVIGLVVAMKKKKNFCTGCGASLRPGAGFCENCGKRV